LAASVVALASEALVGTGGLLQAEQAAPSAIANIPRMIRVVMDGAPDTGVDPAQLAGSSRRAQTANARIVMRPLSICRATWRGS
jgi:hypothetical protein